MALIEGQELKALREAQSDQYIHSEKLHLFIEEVLKEHQLSPQDLSAVAIGAGPGSYTGLRIGVTTAKALAYSLNIPLLSARGPELLVAAVLAEHDLAPKAKLHPMIDARRMEVYTLSHHLEDGSQSEIEAKIIDADSYTDEGPHYFFGDGAPKFKELLKGKEHHFIDLEWPSAAHFKYLLPDKMAQEDFEDVAYFEPFYLKAFQAIKPKSVF